MRSFLPILVLLLSSWTAQADQCAGLKSEPLFKGLISKLDESKKKQIDVLGFRFYDFPILLTGKDAPLCAALYLNSKVEFFHLEHEFEIANGSYTFRNEYNKLEPRDEQQLKFLIEGRKIETFIIYRIEKGLPDEYEVQDDTLRVHFGFLAHEGFHFFKQRSLFNMEHYTAGKPYVSWSAEGREFIKAHCYGPREDAAKASDLELSLLRTAVRQAYLENNPDEARKTIQQFLAVRKGRYELLKDTKFHPDSWSQAETCSNGEAEMEYLEGTTEFVETNYQLETGLISIDQYIKPRFEKGRGGRYYSLGSLQLFLIKKLDPDYLAFAEKIEEGGTPPQESFYTSRLRELVQAEAL